VSSLFRRKSAELPAEPAAEAPAAPEASPAKGYTPGKGKATPKRRTAQSRRAEPPPANRREAYKRVREKEKTERAEARAGMMAGDPRYLLPRDRGPERALVRDIVDARRTAGSWFLGGLVLVLFGSLRQMPPVVQVGANALSALLLLAVAVDSILICLRVRRLVSQRFPDSTVGMVRLYLYAFMRGLTLRGMRIPKPQVNLGEKIS
jgi:hypothetical protein